MVQITISVSDSVYAWLTRKAAGSQQTVEAVLAEQVNRLPEGDEENPEFLDAMRTSLGEHRELLARLAE